MNDIILCDYCGTSLHDPESDVFREDTQGHQCVPMLADRIRELEAENATLRDWDDYFRAVCGFKRDGRPSPECLDEYLAALSPAPVSLGEDEKEGIVDTIEEIISETHDIDVTDRRYAENVVAWLERHHPAAIRALSETEGE